MNLKKWNNTLNSKVISQEAYCTNKSIYADALLNAWRPQLKVVCLSSEELSAQQREPDGD